MNFIKKLIAALFVILPITAIAQDTLRSDQLTVSGFVFDSESGKPIPFASIANGSFSSAFTEIDGSFSIKVKTFNDVLTAAITGYTDKDFVLAGKKNVNIYLTSVNDFSYQIKTKFGYDDQKLVYTTQAVSSIYRTDNIEKLAGTSTEAVFNGSIAGLDVIQRNGTPGAGSEIFIRGFSSLYATNRPLFIVDGMIYDTEVYGSPLISGFSPNPLNDIDIEDIENITIVKDAVSIYGAKAANGVIFIKTKRANEQVTKIELSTYGGLNSAPASIPLLNATDYRLYLDDMIQSSGKTSSDFGLSDIFDDNTSNTNYYRYHNNNNWQKEVFGSGYSSNYNLSIKGGDDVILISASVGYLKHVGSIKNTDFSRYSIRLNGDVNISKLFSVNASFSFVNNQCNLLNGSSLFDNDDPLYMSLIKAPFTNTYIRDEKGIVTPNLEDYDILGVSNPVALINNMSQNNSNYRIYGTFDFHLKLSNDFIISDLIGLTLDKNRENIFVPKEGIVPVQLTLGVGVNRMAGRVLRYDGFNNDFRINYKKSFGQHDIDLMGGARLNLNKDEEDWTKDYNSANDQMRTVGNGVLLYAQNGGLMGNWTNLTYYTSLGYDFQKKYFLTFAASLDGSSRFGKEVKGVELFNSKFGFFPSVSGSWLVSSEPFLNRVSFIDLFKLRLSYGLTGNDDIGNFTSRKSYSFDTFLGYPGLVIGNLWNPKLKWETNTKMNFGVDLSFLKERFSVSLDVFQNKTDDMLFHRPVDAVTGFTIYTENNGSFSTKGMDLSVHSRVINSPVKWDLGLVISKYKTEVNSIYGDKYISDVLGANILTEVGKPLGLFYGYKTNGVFATQQDAINSQLRALMPNTQTVPFNAGDVIFVDSKADHVINSDDMQVIGDPNPDFTGELNTRIRYKEFTLDAALSFCYGNDVFNYLRYKLENMTGFSNQTQTVNNRWRYDGQITDIPKAVYGDPIGNSRFSDRWIEDGSYARLRNVTLSYAIPLKWSVIKNSEVYVTGINLLTFTKYKGYDPEFSYSGYSLVRGIDPGLTPQSKAFYIGLKIGL